MLELKWPNDLLLAGAKLAGILIEGEGREEEGAVAIGIGVNCTAHPAPTAYRATDLARRRGDRLGGRVVCLALRQDAGAAGAMEQRPRLRDHPGRLARPRRRPRREHPRRSPRIASSPAGFEGLDEAGCLVLTGPDGAKEVVAAGEVISFGGSQ